MRPVVKELRRFGLPLDAARVLAAEWENVGYSEREAITWIRVGCCDPSDALLAVEHGYTPKDYQD